MSQTSQNHFTLALIAARVKCWGWWLLSKCMLGIVCIGVIAEGIRLMVPALAMKLHRIPGFAFTKHYEETHALDIAPFLSFFFMVLTWHMAEKAIRLSLLHKPLSTDGERWNTEREAQLVKVIGTLLLTVDCFLFYAASASLTWGGNILALAPLIATAGYLAVLLGVSYVSAKLSVTVDAIKELIEFEAEERSYRQAEEEREIVFAPIVSAKN